MVTHDPPTWEPAAKNHFGQTTRLAVPGGWLYRHTDPPNHFLVFVPAPAPSTQDIDPVALVGAVRDAIVDRLKGDLFDGSLVRTQLLELDPSEILAGVKRLAGDQGKGSRKGRAGRPRVPKLVGSLDTKPSCRVWLCEDARQIWPTQTRAVQSRGLRGVTDSNLYVDDELLIIVRAWPEFRPVPRDALGHERPDWVGLGIWRNDSGSELDFERGIGTYRDEQGNLNADSCARWARDHHYQRYQPACGVARQQTVEWDWHDAQEGHESHESHESHEVEATRDLSDPPMTPGGREFRLDGPPTLQDVRCLLSQLRAAWPSMIIEDDTGILPETAIPELPEQLFIYRDEAAYASWGEHGVTAENADSMVYLRFGKKCLTAVASHPWTPTGKLVSSALLELSRDRLLTDAGRARIQDLQRGDERG